MHNELKLTFVAGGRLGAEIVRKDFSSIVFGRSHSADERLKEPDVSGTHLELKMSEKGVVAINLSKYQTLLNSQQMVRSAEMPLKKGDLLQLGAKVKIRIDSVPKPAAVKGPQDESETMDEADGFVTEATRMPSSGMTMETRAVGPTVALTGATRAMGFSPSSDADAATTDADDDDEAHPVAGAGTDDFVRSSVADAATNEERDTASSADSLQEGKTVEMNTRPISMEELLKLREMDEKKRRRRRMVLTVAIALFACLLGGIWLATMSRKHPDDPVPPKLEDGSRDYASFTLTDADEDPIAFVDYPRHPRLVVEQSNAFNGVEVSSFLGRDRDMPYHLVFSRSESRDELTISLETSFRRWQQRLTPEDGFQFHPPAGGLNYRFYEDDYADECENPDSLHGIAYLRVPFTRTRNARLWHGYCFYFRDGASVFTFLREVPEEYWKTASRFLEDVPDLAFSVNFSLNRWESRGTDDEEREVSAKLDDAKLLDSVRQGLRTPDLVKAWPMLESRIDLLLSRNHPASAHPNAKTYREARLLMHELRRIKNKEYNRLRIAHDDAVALGDPRNRTEEIAKDARAIFGGKVNRSDRRSSLVNNPEIW